MLRPSNDPKAIEFRMFSAACLAWLHAECTQGPLQAVKRRFQFELINRWTGMGDPCVNSVRSQARQGAENIRNSIALGPFDGPSIGRIEIRRDLHQKVATCYISNIADEETNQQRI